MRACVCKYAYNIIVYKSFESLVGLYVLFRLFHTNKIAYIAVLDCEGGKFHTCRIIDGRSMQRIFTLTRGDIYPTNCHVHALKHKAEKY